MKQISNYPDYRAKAALCWSVINLNSTVSKRVGHYFWSVFFVMLMAGLVSSNTATASTPYWEVKGNKDLCVGDGYQNYTAHTNKHYKDDKYEWRFEKNDCGAKIIGSKYGRTVKVHPGYKEGGYKLICIIKRKEYKKHYTYYCYAQVYCKSKVYVDAGKDIYSCGRDKVRLWGTIHGAPKGYWVGGNGTFSGGRGDLRTYYTPTEQEVYQGYVKLKLVAKDKYGKDYYSKCGKNYDEVIIYISKPVYVDAGPNQEFCGLPTVVNLDGIVKGCYEGGYWSLVPGSASGTINNPYSPADATYTPAAADLTRGYADLQLKAKCYSKCGNNHDIVRIIFRQPATVNPGGPYVTCGTAPVALNGSFGGSATSATWTVVTAGGGTITNANTATADATFTPSTDFGAAGTDVTLRLTTNDPDGPCGPVSQDIIIRVDQPATADAGPNQTICYFKWKKDEVRVDLRGVFGGSATSGSFSVVSPTGGTITNASTTGNVVTATFDPTDEQIEAGSVTLRFTTNDPDAGNVCGPATDDVIIYFEKGYYAYCGKPGHGHHDDDDKCDKDEHYVCSHDKKHQLDCKYDGPGGGKWSHNGGGYFENENSLTPTYVATDAEIAEGRTIEATYTPYGDGKRCVRPCKFVIHCKKDNDCGHKPNCDLKLSAEIDKIIVKDGRFKQKGAIDLTVYGGSGHYEYRWRHEGERVRDRFISEDGEDLFRLKSPGYYRVRVIDKKTGCEIICRFYVPLKERTHDDCDNRCHKDGERVYDESNDPTEEDPNAVDDEETVATSAARFGTQAEQASVADEGNQKLSIYPNALKERSTIEFTLDKASDYTLNLYDHTGRLVKQISSGKAKAGEVRKFTIEGAGLKNGIYYGRLITPNATKFTRIVKE